MEEYDIEILHTLAEVHEALGDLPRAAEAVNTALRIIEEQKAKIPGEEDRITFVSKVSVNAAVIGMAERLRTVTSHDLHPLTAGSLRELQPSLVPSGLFPNHLRPFAGRLRQGEIVGTPEDDPAPYHVAATIVPASGAEVLSSILERPFRMERNDSEVPGVFAKNVVGRPFWGDDGRFHVEPRWGIDADLAALNNYLQGMEGMPGLGQRLLRRMVGPAGRALAPRLREWVFSLVGQPGEGQVILSDGVTPMKEGGIKIRLERGDQTNISRILDNGQIEPVVVDNRLVPRPSHFGPLEIMVNPLAGGATMLSVGVQRALYTVHPDNILRALLQAMVNNRP